MTCFINEESQSILSEGVERIVIPLHDPHDLEDLVFHTKRGGTYDVVEWLLSQLHRSTELERVCGLTVTPHSAQIVVNLELRQPGLQMEDYIRRAAGYPIEIIAHEEKGHEVWWYGEVRGYLSNRAVSQEKFTDTHKPWWEKGLPDVPETLYEEETREDGYPIHAPRLRSSRGEITTGENDGPKIA